MSKSTAKPLKILLAVFAIVLFVLVLESLPTTIVKTTKTRTQETSSLDFYYFTGLTDLLEDDLELRLQELGVPEEDYGNLSEYFSADELYAIELKSALAEDLDETWVLADASELAELQTIFALDADSLAAFDHTSAPPAEYTSLADLLETYHYALTHVEDYDLVE